MRKHFPIFFTIAGVLVLLGLGTWQVQRLQWKNAMVAQIDAQSALPPVVMPQQVEDISAMTYARVRLWGKYLHDKEIHLFVGPRQMRGDPGYQILTPLLREDGTAVLVDRGWVDADHKDTAKRPETLDSGIVEVVGMLHPGEHQKTFTPDNDTVKNLWFWIDMEAIKTYTGLGLQNLYVRRLKQEDDPALPIGGEAKVKHRNDHLQYAITWYSLALMLVVIYGLYRKRESESIRV